MSTFSRPVAPAARARSRHASKARLIDRLCDGYVAVTRRSRGGDTAVTWASYVGWLERFRFWRRLRAAARREGFEVPPLAAQEVALVAHERSLKLFARRRLLPAVRGELAEGERGGRLMVRRAPI